MSIRQVLWSDVSAATQALFELPAENRAVAFRQMLSRAEAADLFRKRYRRWHPDWGNGSLAAVAASYQRSAVPFPGDCDLVPCLEVVCSGLVSWRGEKVHLNQRRKKNTSVLPGQS